MVNGAAEEIAALKAELSAAHIDIDRQMAIANEYVNECMALKAKVAKAREALERIAGEDFRGPRPSGAIVAAIALKELTDGE